MSKVKTVLLVCTGNSCRSVMAAGLLKKLLKAKGNYNIITAGTAAIEGMPPTSEAIQAMSEQNIDVSGHKSSPLTDEMIRQADLILVMEKRHKENILGRSLRAQSKVYLLSEFGRIASEKRLVEPDIPDPIGKSLDFYRKTFAVIQEDILRTVKKLEEK